VTREEIDTLVERLDRALTKVAAGLPR